MKLFVIIAESKFGVRQCFYTCLSTGGRYVYRARGSAYRRGGGLPTEGEGVWQIPHEPEKWVVRILLECFLFRMQSVKIECFCPLVKNIFCITNKCANISVL